MPASASTRGGASAPRRRARRSRDQYWRWRGIRTPIPGDGGECTNVLEFSSSPGRGAALPRQLVQDEGAARVVRVGGAERLEETCGTRGAAFVRPSRGTKLVGPKASPEAAPRSRPSSPRRHLSGVHGIAVRMPTMAWGES